MRRRRWPHTLAKYLRIHSSLTTKIARWWNEKATKTETTKHAKLAQVHPVPQTCSSSNSSSGGSIAHSRTRKKWFQYWADNRMVMKNCYSSLGYKTTARTLFATIFISIQFVVWFCADFTQLIFLRGRQWVNLMNIIDKKKKDSKWNTISRRNQIIFPTRERHFYRFTNFRVVNLLCDSIKRNLRCLWDSIRILSNIFRLRSFVNER